MNQTPQTYYPDSELVRLVKEAILAEKMAVRNYDILLGVTASPEDRAVITQIRRDERRHLMLLQDIYETLTGKEYPESNAPASMPQNYCQMIKTSICDELEAAVFYEKLAGRLPCMKQKETVCGILNDEKQHARALAAIYKRCTRA